MNKSAIKTFAVESRRKLMEDVEYKMSLVGITKNGITESISTAEGIETFKIAGSQIHSIYDEDIERRASLVHEVENKGFENVVEEVAYTWFNRIIAIRFMEVNNYLPTKTRVLSSETPGKIEPDIITEAFNLDLDYTSDDKELIFKLKDENKLDELFRFLFIKQCNKLNDILPGLFEKTKDYMELLLNISFTSEEGVVRQLINNITEEDFGEQVEIIGWLYQYYNVELKDETFANLKKKIKISKERIPAVTQLFTPEWIVKYMVENSVGRLWLENHPNEELKSQWKYYVEDAEQLPEVEKQLLELKNQNISLENIKVIDPSMGSGHILVYIFDVLMQIYISEGYTEKDAAISILKNNLYGLDIDDRAYQLSYFALMMKARSYNRKIFKMNIVPLISSIQESNELDSRLINYINQGYPEFSKDLDYLNSLFKDAKLYGSILNVKKIDFDGIINLADEIKHQNFSILDDYSFKKNLKLIKLIAFTAKLLNQKYDVVITNPPYMGSKGMNKDLSKYVKSNYPLSKSDMFSVFIEKCHDLCKLNGLVAMITQQSFMFLSTFEKLRDFLINNKTFLFMVHLGAHAFDEIGGEVVQATTFINRNSFIENYCSTFYRLIDFNSEKTKEIEFFNQDNKLTSYSSDFNKIPGTPFAYWADKHVFEAFQNGTSLIDVAEVKVGLQTGDNNRFLRYWFEVDYATIGFNIGSCDESKNSNLKWFPYNKGGNYRKWYGNQEYIVNWENDGYEIRNFKDSRGKLKSRPQNSNFYFNESLSWSKISSGSIAFRNYPLGFLFDVAGCSVFINQDIYCMLGFLNSIIAKKILGMISPTLNYEVGHISSLPIIKNFNNKIKIYILKFKFEIRINFLKKYKNLIKYILILYLIK